jgi:hypothetical protein
MGTMKYIFIIFTLILSLYIKETTLYNFSYLDLNRRLKIPSKDKEDFTLSEFFKKDFINDNWEKLKEGVNFILPDEYRNKKTIFEARACIKNDKRYVVVNIEGKDVNKLVKKVENFIEEIKSYPPYDDVKLILQHGEINPKEPLIDAFSILNLNNLEFSIVIDDLEFYGKKGDVENELAGDGYTQIDKVSRNVLTNLFKCICNEILYYLSPGQIDKLVSSMFEGKKQFVSNLISIKDYYQDLIKGRADIVTIPIQEHIERTVKEIKDVIERLNYGISYLQRPDKGNLYYRIFYRHYIKPNVIIPKGNQPIRLNIPNGN